MIIRETGGPAARVTLGSVPPKIFRPVPSSAETAMVRLDPTGAWILTGMSCPLVGFETGTVVVGGTGMSGPDICTLIVEMSDTD